MHASDDLDIIHAAMFLRPRLKLELFLLNLFGSFATPDHDPVNRLFFCARGIVRDVRGVRPVCSF